MKRARRRQSLDYLIDRAYFISDESFAESFKLWRAV